MKAKRIIVIVISILVPLIITIFVGLYSYGTIGNWTKNQEAFVDDYFNGLNKSSEVVEGFVNFNSDLHKINKDIYLYKDYTTSDEIIKPDEQGYFTLDHMKMAYYTTVGVEAGYDKYAQEFYFFDIDNTEVNMSKLAFVVFEEAGENNEMLKTYLYNYQLAFKNGELTKLNKENLTFVSKNMFFTNGDALEDITGTAKIVGGTPVMRHLYFTTPTYAYNNSGKTMAQIQYATFALVELNYDSNNNPASSKVITTGFIKNEATDKNSYIELNPDIEESFGLNTYKSMNKAGYFKYIWKTILLQMVVSLAITGVLGYLFYHTWTLEQKNKENPQPKNKKRS